MTARVVLILHGVNVWNTGDLGLLEVTVARLREELGEGVELWTENVFSHPDATLDPHLRRLRLRNVPPLIPLRQNRGWSRARWLIHVAAVVAALIATRILGPRVIRLLPEEVAASLRAFRQADVIVSKPGGHLYSTADRRIGSPTYLLAIWAATVLRRPTVIYAQSVGPFAGRAAAWVARTALRGVSLATARERRTSDWLQSALPHAERVHLTADEAFELPVDLDADSPARERVLGMTAVTWGFPGHPDPARARSAYEDALVDVARWYIDDVGGSVSLVRWLTGNHRENDTALIDRIGERIERPGRVTIIGPFSPVDASRQLGRTEMMVASRLHSGIFAMVAGTPVVAVEYLPKTSEVMAMATSREWSIPIDAVGNGRLLGKAQALHSNLEDVKKVLAGTLPELRDRAAANAALVRELLERGPGA